MFSFPFGAKRLEKKFRLIRKKIFGLGYRLKLPWPNVRGNSHFFMNSTNHLLILQVSFTSAIPYQADKRTVLRYIRVAIFCMGILENYDINEGRRGKVSVSNIFLEKICMEPIRIDLIGAQIFFSCHGRE